MSTTQRPPVGAAARPVLDAGAELLADGEWLSTALDAARGEVVRRHRELVEPRVQGLPEDLRDAVAPWVAPVIRHDPADEDVTPLVVAVHELARLLPLARPLRPLTERVVPALRVDLPAAQPAGSRTAWLFGGTATREAASAAFRHVEQAVAWASSRRITERVAAARGIREAPDAAAAAWASFAADPAGFHALLQQTAGLRPELAGVAGQLTPETAERIEGLTLDGTFTSIELRAYQSFGARFLLANERAVLSDALGLGKGVQVLAAFAHLHASGRRRFLVVCPATAAENWLREVRLHTRLERFRLDGRDPGALAGWLARGGVGVATPEDATALDLPASVRLDVLVGDGTLAPASLDARGDWVWRLGVPGAGVERGRTPSLRRTSDDVLAELPPVQTQDEWCSFVGADRLRYLETVATGNFSAMRRAAFASADPAENAKVERLLELVGEAVRDGHRVVVFSYFLGVLATVVAALQDAACPGVLGPLTAATPRNERQAMVAALAAADCPGVLVAQVQAGGADLDLRAASVVVFCEPQLDATMESAAVARARRTDQLQSIQVHRLLALDSVDERVLERRDRGESEVVLARSVVATEQARLGLGR